MNEADKSNFFHFFPSVVLAVVLLLVPTSCQQRDGDMADHGCPEAGVVVESVVSHSNSERAGLREGDILLSWKLTSAVQSAEIETHGTILSTFDWWKLELEYAPRGEIILTGARANQAIDFTVRLSPAEVMVRPALDPVSVKDHNRARLLMDQGDFNQAKQIWDKLIRDYQQRSCPEIVWWFHDKIATEAIAIRHPQSGQLLETSLARAEQINRLEARLITRLKLAVTLISRNDYDAAEVHLSALLDLEKQHGIEGLQHARSLSEMGKLRWFQGRLDEAEQYHQVTAAIRCESASQSLDYASSLNNLGILADERGKLDQADQYYREALAIVQNYFPEDQSSIDFLNNLAVLAHNRGDYELADHYFQRVLKLDMAQEKNSLNVANSLANLGIIAHARYDYETAEHYFLQALQIEEQLSPGSNQVALSLVNLGAIARKRRDLDAAEAYFTKGLTILEQHSPGSLVVARNYNNLGNIAFDRGNLSKAFDYYFKALTMKQALAPDSLECARTLFNLGRTHDRNNEQELARKAFEEALKIVDMVSPENSLRAETLYSLGLLSYRRNEVGSAIDYLCRALDVLEHQISQLGGHRGARTDFQDYFIKYYRDLSDMLSEADDPIRAFDVLERSRARLFLEFLSDRQLTFTADIVADLETQRQKLSQHYNSVQEKLWTLSPLQHTSEMNDIQHTLKTIQAEYDRVVASIRARSPHYAALHFPVPKTFAEICNCLAPGTAMLSYSVNTTQTTLFMVMAGQRKPVTYQLPIGMAELRQRITTFRSLLTKPFRPDQQRLEMYDQGKQLYDVLIQPCTKMLKNSPTLLIVPDGPLHLLPFAALVQSYHSGSGKRGEGPGGTYLVQSKSLHQIVSATVYCELKEEWQHCEISHYTTEFAAFADPIYPKFKQEEEQPLLSFLRSQYYELAPLPETRTEVERIAGFYPGKATLFIGPEATETNVLCELRKARYVHFACHAFIDNVIPLNSGLLLSIPDQLMGNQENGFLQAWEILQQSTTSTELVVLSACDSGLGKESGSEGLIGLTRSFHYAGVPSIVATLWPVSDSASRDLMVSFYHSLSQGKSKAEALRLAQLQFLQPMQPDQGKPGKYSHPFFWSAFQLYGYY